MRTPTDTDPNPHDPNPHEHSTQDPADSIEVLLRECLVRFEAEGPEAIEEILEREPSYARALRERIATLERFGLFDNSDLCDQPGSNVTERLGDFELVKKIGAGGMGVVYLAQDHKLGRLVALKVLRRSFTGSERASARFEREAKAVARLHHPHIVQVYQTGQTEGVDWIAMEFVPGQGLDEILGQAARGHIDLPLPRILGWIRDIAYALEAAHQAGIVHRDIKPSNIRITPDGRATLLDFGLATDVEAHALTRTGSFQGSPYYASPEQIESKKGKVGPWSDLYSLGITLYEAAAGKVPFEGKTTEQVFHQVLSGAPQRPRKVNRQVSRDLETVILKAVEKDPRQRYDSMAAFAEDLQCVLDFRPIRARPVGPIDKVRKWARRNKALAGAMVITILSLLSLPVYALATSAAARQSRIDEAGRLLALASTRIEDLGRIRTKTREKRIRLHERLGYYVTRHVSVDEEHQIAGLQRDLRQASRQRLTLSYEVLGLLTEAEKLDPDSQEPRRLRADLYMERWRYSSFLIRQRKYLRPRDLQDAREESRFFRELVQKADIEQRYANELVGKGRFTIDLGNLSGRVHLFRFQEQSELFADGEQRLVPISLHPPKLPEGLRPGTECLRVEESGQGLLPEDLIFEVEGHPIEGTVLLTHAKAGLPRYARLYSVDGTPVRRLAELSFLPEIEGSALHRFEFHIGKKIHVLEAKSLDEMGLSLVDPLTLVRTTPVTARVFCGGTSEVRQLQPGLVIRKTACPLLYDRERPFCRTGAETSSVGRGGYLALIEGSGFRPVRFILQISEGELTSHRIDPPREGEVPSEFRMLHRSKSIAGKRVFMMDHEVSCAEYLEFLNQPETLEFIRSSPIPTRFPRFTENAETGGYWPKKDGAYTILEAWKPDWPILGISWNDAKAYTVWRTEQARKAGKKIRYRLPTSGDWAIAAWSEGFFVFGNQFRQHWLSSCNALPKPGPEPVMSYCVDESPLGFFDMSGSAFEYAEGWYWKERRMRPLMGGSWAMAQPEKFRANFWTGAGEDGAWDTYGFRMVLEEQDG